MPPKSFILVLRSADDNKGFATNFTYHFDPLLILNGRWQVALTDYISPNSDHFIYNRNIIFECVRQDGQNVQGEKGLNFSKKVTFNLSAEDNVDGPDIAQKIIDKLDMKEMFDWSADKKGHLKYKPLISDGIKYILRVNNPSILSTLGFDIDEWDNLNSSNKGDETLISRHTPEWWFNDRTVCVKTNILPQKYNILGVFPDRDINTDYSRVVMKVSTPIYLDLEDNSFSKINIKFCDPEGNELESKKGYTTVVLHFRKV